MQARSTATVRIRESLPGNHHNMDLSTLDDEPQPSTSAETIRHLPLHISFTPDPVHASRPGTSSQPSSPRSGLPSPSSPSGDSVSSLPSVSSSFLFSSGPGSPPHLGQPPEHDSDFERGDSSLIIPSLTLPAPVRKPTMYGQAVGDVRLLVLGRKDLGAESVIEAFTDTECKDIVDVGKWEAHEAVKNSLSARCCRISTDWIEHRDAHGLERHEPSRNVEIVHLPEYDGDDECGDIVRNALESVHSAFRSVHAMVHPDQPPSDSLANLLSSPTTPLYTAMILATSRPLMHLEYTLIAELSTHIPLIILPPLGEVGSLPLDTHPYARPRRPSRYPQHDAILARKTLGKARLSSLQPASAHTLRTSIFREPEALTALRLEAVDRFLRWREVERAVGRLMRSPDSATLSSSQSTTRQSTMETPAPAPAKPRWGGGARWDKAQWEAEWEDALSVDVARTLRARRRVERAPTVTAAPDYFSPKTPMSAPDHQTLLGVAIRAREHKATQAAPPIPIPARFPPFDPLHIPSLLAFSLSLLAPLRERIAEALGLRSRTDVDVEPSEFAEAGARSGELRFGEAGDGGVYGRGGVGGWALASAFCTGVGVGIVLARM